MTIPTRQSLSVDETLYLTHHVVLPPKLPQQNDFDARYDRGLLDTTIRALQAMRESVKDCNARSAVSSGITSIESLRDSRDIHGNVSEQQLLGIFQKLASAATNESIPFEIKAQNAGLLVSRCGQNITFESFELSPVNNAAMSSMGRLVRTFPGTASKIPAALMQDRAFKESLAYTIAKMITQAAPGTQPHVQKNGENMDEDRDTTHPKMVTEWLINYIAALGESASATRISKNTREEILWSNCRHPWRRSPLWLLVRITLQLLFTRQEDTEQPLSSLYKTFIAEMLSQILASAQKHWKILGNEVLYIICAKLGRRLRKLEKSEQLGLLKPQWVASLASRMKDAHSMLKRHWKALSEGSCESFDTTLLQELQPARDLDLALPDLGSFLASVADRVSGTEYTEFRPSMEYPTFPANKLPTISNAGGEYKVFRLAAFETWVEHHLPSWVAMHLSDRRTCRHLRDVIKAYHAVASVAYAGLPSSLSIMYLTILELWIACDKSACRIHPMLLGYDSELRVDECQCLILPLKRQMERLAEIERYLQSRQDAAVHANPSLFRDFGHASSFAVRYYDQSLELQEVFSRIERDATEKQLRKREELADLKRQYRDLMHRYNSRDCETHEVTINYYLGDTESQHKPNCSRCALKRKAEGLDIHIYEWPLPSTSAIAKATIFELRIPENFSDWRDVTMYLLATVLGWRDRQPTQPQFKYTLDKHHGLAHLLSPRYRERRIIPLSSIKPHTSTHRKQTKSIINLRDEDVCLPNALRYAYFDRTLGTYTGVCGPAEDLVQKCMYRMPNSRTRALERFMSRPPSTPDGPSPNEVIANLSDCPEHFSIDEYRALGMLPLGKNILYSNILAQIAAPAVDFSKSETQTLMLQIVGQTGVPRGTGDARRVSHQILTESSFGHAMLEQVEIASRRVSENWESWRALASFVVLARRILSLTLSSEVQARSLALLDYARRVSMKWLARLKQRASASTNDKQRSDLYSRATEVALLCVSTFDVDDDFINIVLQQKSAISMLLQCSIVVQENYHAIQSESKDIYRTMLQDWRALLYRAFPTFRQSLLRDNAGLNDAVLANWAAFQPTTNVGWVILSKTHGHWLHTTSGSLAVHLNLLTGELLVNGLPLARLPSEYMQHPMYVPLFQKKTLEIVPTDRPGMEFSLKSTFQDCQLHFGMGGVDMYVVAIRDHIAYDLLPSRLFKGQLPFAFVENYIHWYDHGQDMVIFRPRDDPWSFGEVKWRLVRCGSAWQLSNGVNVVTNWAGNTARILSRILGPLEDKQHIHTLWDAATSSVLINLPRLQLDFHIESHNLRIKSRQLRGMIVDPDQTLGTLIGLVSKLALKSMDSMQDRLVLIPVPRTHDARAVTYVQVPDQHHVSVAINKDQAYTTYTYSLDTIIGRVQDSGDAQRKLFLAFLHALTSHCLPDPLTGYTGTESALRILQSASLRSFEFLTVEDVNLLGRIAALSPTRKFYPSHLMEMQQIGWNRGLPVLSQHPYLRKFTKDIIHQAERMRLFNPDSMPDVSRWKSSNPHLDARDAIRSSLFRVWNFGGELFTSRADESYNARDVLSNSEKGLRAYTAATLLVREDVASDHMVSNLKDILLHTHFKKATVKGESILFDSSTLRFDSKWLTNSSAILTENWCNLHYTLSASSPTCNKFDIAAWLSTMAFATSADMDVIQALVAFYRLRDMATIRPPSASEFHLAHGASFRAAEVRTIVQNYSTSFNVSAEMRLPRQPTENARQHSRRVRTLFNSRRDSAIQKLVEDLQLQWPDEAPVRPRFTDVDAYINVSAAMPSIVAKFGTWYRNRGFIDYIRQISALMEQQEVVKVAPPRNIANAPLSECKIDDNSKIFVADNIFAATPPVISAANALSPPGEPVFPIKELYTSVGSGRMKLRLENLCNSLQNYAKSRCEQVYVDDLRVSCGFLENNQQKTFEKSNDWSDRDVQRVLQTYLGDCEKYLECLSLALAEAIASNGSFVDGLSLSMQHAPRISPTFWLGQLHCDNFTVLSEGWKTAVIEYGLTITQLHRARRLLAVSSSPTDLIEELSYVGHSNWQPRDFPETLLLEAESGILIRREQEFIASHMRDPEGANNIVLQLLMGGGKSSTIVPVLVVYLTTKKNLVRVIVAKPQSKQMLQMLVSKLGCLLNRRIYHMPFTRALRPTATEADLIREIYEECIANRGVLLVQPEHILSFKLMAVESALTGQACAQSLLGTQRFFDDVSRDIVDESDENFSVKFELIYTMGSQRPIEFAPERWFLIQAITGLIPRFAAQVKQRLPDHIEIQGNVTDGRFPRVRLLRDDAADMLLTLIAKHVVEFGAVGLPTSSQPPDVQVALFNFITQSEPTPRDIQTVENSRFWTVTTESPLLLVRGLFAGGILRFALSTKRWRVNFGLDPARVPKTLLAVPFRSKDCPSPRSEFSHPDVVILLSLLSYYYGGLTDEQLFDSFTHLQRSDQSTIHYDEWVSTATSSLPTAFRQLCGVSTKDTHQCLAEIFPCLRFSRKAIDYYLSYLVFPKVMKEFPQKLSASGWDIGATKNNPLTGFSGTNDTLHLLPLTVQHLDLPSQKHTNALVLQYLLQDENTVTILQKRTRETDAEHVLSVIVGMKPEVRVLLDCGASILEQNNRQVAETWLKMRDHVIKAVVFFDDEELSVLDRTGRVESLQTSPFAKQLDSCLVYLDESHTRGTDLRLPRKYRAGVTLGQSLTKDKLTQGCMRMRKLGFGQSVVFITPEDIARKIRERTCKDPGAKIGVEDVLCWSIGETWEDLKRSMPLWAVQGERFERTKNLLGGAATSPEQVRAFLEDEAQTLKDRYKPLPQGDRGGELLKKWNEINTNIAKIVQRCRDFDAMGFGTATLSEEQERELAPEIEQEKQIERPPRLPAEIHRIHPALERLVHTGDLTVHAAAFRPAFQALASTSAAKLFEITDLPTDLLVTTDFMRTVKISNSSSAASFVSDSYQRPVQFLLSVPSVTKPRYTRTLVIISPFEANELRSAVIKYKKVTLHLYSPRANAIYAPLDKLTLYNAGLDFCANQIPRSTTLQLNLFAGSLYLRSFEEYREICDFLGLLQSKPQKDQQVFADGFIKPPVGIWGLQESPVPFLRCLLMKIRREGEGVELTHLGKILNGMRMERDEFNTNF